MHFGVSDVQSRGMGDNDERLIMIYDSDEMRMRFLIGTTVGGEDVHSRRSNCKDRTVVL